MSERASRAKWTARLAALSARLPARAKLTGGLAQGLMSAGAAVLAYLPTRPLGLQEGFWGSITAIAVVQNEMTAVKNSARDQFAGAAVGGLFGAAIVSLVGQSLAAYALSIVVAACACWILNISSAARLAASTVTILVLVPHRGSVEGMMASRIAEVAWGVTVGIAVVFTVNHLMRRTPRESTPP